MKAGIIVLFATVSIVFLVGCLGPELKDCGEDIDCFIEAASNCTPAKMNYIQLHGTGPPGGPNYQMVTYMEISGGTMDECVSYYKITGTDAPDAASQSMIGMDMRCTSPTSVFQEDTFNLAYLANPEYADCSGPIKDVLVGPTQNVPSLPTFPADEGQKQVHVERCYEDDRSIDIRNVRTTTVPAGTLFNIYKLSDGSDTGATVTLTSDLEAGVKVTVQATRTLEDSTSYFLLALDIPSANFFC